VSAERGWSNRAVRSVRRRVGPQALRRHWWLDIVKTRGGAEVIRNWSIDRRYGGRCGGAIASRFADTGAYGTSSADYWQLRRIFSAENGLEIQPGEKLVDAGCGKGRALNHWLSLERGNSIVGLELDPEFADLARRRLAGFKNVEVLTGDAVTLLPDDASIIFVFNAFGEPVVRRLRDRIVELYAAGDGLRIVYYFAMHRGVFDEDPRFEVVPFRRKVFHPGVVVRRVA
jgi:SAM-dependent methyltransferase